MTRRKSVCLKGTLVLLVVLVCPSVYTRPQEVPAITASSANEEKTTSTPIRETSTKTVSPSPEQLLQPASPAPENTARDVKSKTPIRESIKMVAIQLMDKPNSTIEAPIISDTRVPPKLKTQVKHRIRTRNEDEEQYENAHPGEAVPVSMEDLDTDHKVSEVKHESATSNEGISTWHSLGNGPKDNTPTEPTKLEEKEKKTKPVKSKPKRPQTNKINKRPIIGSTNKADLVAGGSAINENVLNKLKDTVLTSVQKNKNTIKPSTTTTTTTSTTTTTEATTTKKETKPNVTPSVNLSNKIKKKNKNKQKTTSTTSPSPIIDDTALLPTEAKEQEIELEVSTPATTTKKPKRSSTKKKNKTKKRKTSTPKPSTDVAISDVKTSNKTKTNKNSKKPTVQTGAITTQIYNYLSREVMPSVGVGMLGLASLVGIAGYFLYPFATPVRRTFEVDKSDDLYRNNAEEYANDGNGQAEEEMLGTVLAGMPAHAKQKLNPYAAQTTHINRYPVKKEQDIRYRYVTPSYNPNYKMHYAQQKTGIAHAAVYSKPLTYGSYESRHSYTTEGKYNYEKAKQPNYTPYSAAAVEPIYAAPQTGPSGISAYGSDASNSVVYGVKPSSETDFKPVYPFEGQFFSETTSSPVTYSPTSMYLGSNNNADNQEDVTKYEENSNNSEASENHFVVGNVPKELSDSATPAVVPEHGPRKLREKRSVTASLEELLNEPDFEKDPLISNEIDDFHGSKTPVITIDSVLTPYTEMQVSEIPEPTDASANEVSNLPNNDVDNSEPNNVNTEETEGDKISPVSPTDTETTNTEIEDYVENISTVPIRSETTTEAELYDEPESTTESVSISEDPSSTISTTPDSRRINYVNKSTTEPTMTYQTEPDTVTKTTSEVKLDTLGIVLNTAPPTEQPKEGSTVKPVEGPAVVATTESSDFLSFPPASEFGIYSLLQKIVVFKLRLGLGLIQSTVDVLNKLKLDTTSVLNSV